MVMFIPLLFFAASNSLETSTVSRNPLQLAGWIYFGVLSYLLAVALINDRFLSTLPFTILLFYLVFRPVTAAFKVPTPENVRKALEWAYFSTIILDANIACAFSGLVSAFLILCLLPITWLFAVREWGRQPSAHALQNS